MVKLSQNAANITETATSFKPQSKQEIPNLRSAISKIISLETMKEIIHDATQLTDGEREACNRATD